MANPFLLIEYQSNTNWEEPSRNAPVSKPSLQLVLFWHCHRNRGNQMADRPTEARHPASAGCMPSAPIRRWPGFWTRSLPPSPPSAPPCRPMPLQPNAPPRRFVSVIASLTSAQAPPASWRWPIVWSFTEPLASRSPRRRCFFAGGADALLHRTGAVEDDPALAAADVARAGLGAGDVALCLSASGTTPYTRRWPASLRAAKATVIGFANVPGSPLLTDGRICPFFLKPGPRW